MEDNLNGRTCDNIKCFIQSRQKHRTDVFHVVSAFLFVQILPPFISVKYYDHTIINNVCKDNVHKTDI